MTPDTFSSLLNSYALIAVMLREVDIINTWILLDTLTIIQGLYQGMPIGYLY